MKIFFYLIFIIPFIANGDASSDLDGLLEKHRFGRGFVVNDVRFFKDTSPREYFKILQRENYSWISFEIDSRRVGQWVDLGDVIFLAQFVDSDMPCPSITQPVYSTLPTEKSCLGEEVSFLIFSHIYGYYPPPYSAYERFGGREGTQFWVKRFQGTTNFPSPTPCPPNP
jgi:hypothetical protein